MQLGLLRVHVDLYAEPMPGDTTVLGRVWRPGRHHPQIVYAMQGDAPANEDMMLAVFWDDRVAALVIEQHNRWLGYQGRSGM